jgi:hypothetical protein
VEFARASEVLVRAWDSSMNTQPAHITWNLMGMMNNCHFRILVHKHVDDQVCVYMRLVSYDPTCSASSTVHCGCSQPTHPRTYSSVFISVLSASFCRPMLPCRTCKHCNKHIVTLLSCRATMDRASHHVQ